MNSIGLPDVHSPGLEQVHRDQPIYRCPVSRVLVAFTNYCPGFLPTQEMLGCPNALDTERGVCCSLMECLGACPVFRQGSDDIVTMAQNYPDSSKPEFPPIQVRKTDNPVVSCARELRGFAQAIKSIDLRTKSSQS